MFRYESQSEPVASGHVFTKRLARAGGIWLVLTLGGLAIGMAGYAATEGMSAVDAFLNAAMILSGMGPVSELRTVAGKLFAGFYAIFSGLLIVIATGFVLAPLAHRVLHQFHADENDPDDEDDDDHR